MTRKHVVPLGPVALAKLASLAMLEDALAETIDLEVRDDNAQPHQPLPAFTPTAKLKRFAARGIASVVAAANPQLTGVTAEHVAERLIAVGVDTDTARGVARVMEGRGVLTTLTLSDAQFHDALTAILVGAQLTDERI